MTLRKASGPLRQEAPGTALPGRGTGPSLPLAEEHTPPAALCHSAVLPGAQRTQEFWLGLQSVFTCSEVKGLYCQGRLENPEALGSHGERSHFKGSEKSCGKIKL